VKLLRYLDSNIAMLNQEFVKSHLPNLLALVSFTFAIANFIEVSNSASFYSEDKVLRGKVLPLDCTGQCTLIGALFALVAESIERAIQWITHVK
jgi:hypothetical protein